MKNTVYVQLLGEGTQVYRPVPASQVAPIIYVLGGAEFYYPEDEEWEFLPGARVVVEERIIGKSDAVLVAIASD
jgi:hypothetical protein